MCSKMTCFIFALEATLICKRAVGFPCAGDFPSNRSSENRSRKIACFALAIHRCGFLNFPSQDGGGLHRSERRLTQALNRMTDQAGDILNGVIYGIGILEIPVPRYPHLGDL